MNKVNIKIVAILVIATLVLFLINQNKGSSLVNPNANIPNNMGEEFQLADKHPLTIESLREREYHGSDLVIEETLQPGSDYSRYVASYKSDGLKIYGFLTMPDGEKPKDGWPAIIFNHGYIPPREYRTTERYAAYVDGFARNGYIVFKPDYRGHGDSEGEAVGAYGSNSYTIDVLNAFFSVKKFQKVNPDRIGMWGHSLGGFLTLRSMVVSKDIKAGVIWAGVVASYPDLINNWRRGRFTPPPGIPQSARRWRDMLIEVHGTPEQNPQFWVSLSANSYLSDVSGPLQLHHGTQDASVPLLFSQKLSDQLKAIGKEVEVYEYPGDDHNISQSFNLAIQRSIDFFDKYLKN